MIFVRGTSTYILIISQSLDFKVSANITSWLKTGTVSDRKTIESAAPIRNTQDIDY